MEIKTKILNLSRYLRRLLAPFCSTVCFLQNLPVLISVDSPDHSNADAHGSQDERPQGQLTVFDREPKNKGTESILKKRRRHE